jgi:hypothetical protein
MQDNVSQSNPRQGKAIQDQTRPEKWLNQRTERVKIQKSIEHNIEPFPKPKSISSSRPQ